MSTTFLEDCLAQAKLLEPQDYPLEDSVGEKNYGLDLISVVQRAKSNKGRLLGGQKIWVTENIHGGFDTYKSIIELNGGTCLLFRGRPGSIPAPVEEPDDEKDSNDEYLECYYLVSGATAGEVRLWPRFRAMVKDQCGKPRIVRTDWMLDLALSQQIVWNDKYELVETDSDTQRQVA